MPLAMVLALATPLAYLSRREPPTPVMGGGERLRTIVEPADGRISVPTSTDVPKNGTSGMKTGYFFTDVPFPGTSVKPGEGHPTAILASGRFCRHL